MEEKQILCRFCALKNDCKRRANKTKYEDAGWRTFCTMSKPIRRSREEIEKWKKRKQEGQKNSRRR